MSISISVQNQSMGRLESIKSQEGVNVPDLIRISSQIADTENNEQLIVKEIDDVTLSNSAEQALLSK